jgi:hypothetical protein
MDEMTDDMSRMLEAKRARRMVLARLPYDEKVRILIKLQLIAAPLARMRGKKAVVFRADSE